MSARTGNIVVLVVLVLFLLTSLGISYVALTRGDKQRAEDPAAGTQAFENAQAGISEVLARMSVPGREQYIGQPPGSYSPGWGRYVVNKPGSSSLDPQHDVPATDGLDNDGDGAVDEVGEHYPETGSRQISLAGSNRLDYPWVKVRYKLNAANEVILFGDHDDDPTTPPRENLVRGVPKIIVTAAGSSGHDTRIVTVEAVKWPLPPVMAAVYSEGTMAFRGAGFQIDGHDHGIESPWEPLGDAASLPGIASPNDPNAISAELIGPRAQRVRGSGGLPSVASSSMNLDLQAMDEGWSRIADVTLSGDQRDPAPGSWGSIENLKIVNVEGNLSVSDSLSGAGVLLVQGNLDWGGQARWSGMIICLGDATIHGGGAAPTILGSLVIQGTLTGRSEVTEGTKILYSSAMIRRLAALTGYEVSSWIDQ
ncbi:MAG TPA: hypothetical protein VER77_03095 [Candidatus Dormibacteraeota bacterium]|nr:hypothetical protein [Candidatus Dormibacteraeota bacterium]